MRRIGFISLLFLIVSQQAFSQVYNPVKWTHSVVEIKENSFKLTFEADIEEGWHMYGLTPVEDGPYPTSVNFTEKSILEEEGETTSSKAPEIKFDQSFNADLELFDGKVSFSKIVSINSEGSIEGYVEYMVCNDNTCLPPASYDFKIALGQASEKAPEKEEALEKKEAIPTLNFNHSALQKDINIDEKQTQKEETEEPKIVEQQIKTEEGDIHDRTLMALFFIALAAGFGALLTPCVYPMIPLTVSFFMKEGQSKRKSVFNGIAFGLSIILIYTLVGLISGLFKIDLVRLISSHWIPNLVFFAIFIVLALSFFGMFEIVLPSSIANKIDRQADKGGVMGPFFMALATVIVSFSCTGPIVGVVLGSALKGDLITPVIGMLGFSISFALPFTLLAIFPGVMGNLPKSGGWLNSVKVFFAFILLAFSLVFLSNLGLAFIGRDIILSITIIIFVLLGAYLLGKIRFAHDSPVDTVSIFRLILAILSFSISIYLLPGLWGKPMGAIEPFLPAQKATSSYLSTGGSSAISESNTQILCDESPKFADKLHLPHGIIGYYDYEEGLQCAAEQGKPVFLDFVGHSCKNCKKMYADVWSDPRVLEILKNNYIVIGLYTDDRTKLPETEWYTSSFDNKEKKTLGAKNLAIQVEKFGTNAIPLYAIVDENGDVITQQKTYTYNTDVESFIAYLKEGI